MRVKLYSRTVGGGPELYVRLGQFDARFCWGQVALWKRQEPVFDWLNPLVWCWHGNGLHLRGKPIEPYNG